MYLYTKDKQTIKFDISPENRLGTGVYGSVFKLSEDTCIKVYKNAKAIENNILGTIKSLNLPNYYRIYEFYYQKNEKLKAHTMEYYQPKEIDILTEPTTYTLDNLLKLFKAVEILTRNNILMTDTHTENVILGENSITVIDTDLYTFNKYYKELELELKNKEALRNLFSQLYLEAIKKYHPDLDSYLILSIIDDIFKLYSKSSYERVVETLSQYKYPIEYLRKIISHKTIPKSLTRVLKISK